MVDNHVDSDERDLSADNIDSKSNGKLKDEKFEEGFQSETTEARMESDTETCYSVETARGVDKRLTKTDTTDIDDNSVTNEVRLGEGHNKSSAEMLKQTACSSEIVAYVKCPGIDTTEVEQLGSALANGEPKHHVSENEFQDNCNTFWTKYNAEAKRLVPEASCKSKWLPWALDVSGKIRSILKEVRGMSGKLQYYI